RTPACRVGTRADARWIAFVASDISVTNISTVKCLISEPAGKLNGIGLQPGKPFFQQPLKHVPPLADKFWKWHGF
ncbi:MAG TPA: hypothetical protein VEU96_23645, partial [Bryobacteraceae bacterium]|nr:hypothetical protein [Bryobacteraceae bacterium]